MDEQKVSGGGGAEAGRRWTAGEEILGRYVVEGELGEGKLGVLYACLDKEEDVRVAVRCLSPALSHDSESLEKVREHCRLMEGLRHPNIAGCKTFEKDERGGYFWVMDLVEGKSLRQWLREKHRNGKVGLSEALPVLRQVAAALDYAHWARVTHGDVRPESMLIDGEGWVKVLDFGLPEEMRTSGSEPYMSPELWEGQPPSPESDQYALGVVAYEMLAGHLPFEDSNPARLKDTVLKGEVRSIPGLPAYAMSALRRVLAKRDEERFRSCVSFVRALAGRVRRRKGRGQSLMVWGTVLVLLGVGVLLGRGRVMKMVRRVFPPKQEVVKEAVAEPEVAEEVTPLPEGLWEEAPALEEAMREESLSQEEWPMVVADELPAEPEEVRSDVATSDSGTEIAADVAEMSEPSENTDLDAVASEAETVIVADAGEPPALPEETRQQVVLSEEQMEEEPEQAQMREPTLEEHEAAERGERFGRRLVQAARAYRDAKQWAKCLAAAEAVLSDDPENAEAKALKAEAEEKLRPRIALQATLDGKKVNATVTKGMAHAGRMTPIVVNVKKGGVYGFMAEYETGGKRYEGRILVKAKERGVTPAVIVLREAEGALGAQ